MTHAATIDTSDPEAGHPRALAPRITHPGPEIDPPAARAAAADLLTALGMDLSDPDLAETPRRMAQALLEMTAPPEFELTTFPNEQGYDELVLVQDIPVRSLCEHHMLPFVGVAHVGYLPGDAHPRAVEVRPDGRLPRPPPADPGAAHQADRRAPRRTSSQPRGVGVVIEAEHTCMSLRGARATGTRTVTSALLRAAARRSRRPGRVPRP